MGQMKLIVKRTRNFFRGERWYYVLVGANGETMMHSEPVHNLGDAIASCESIRANAGDAKIEIDRSGGY